MRTRLWVQTAVIAFVATCTLTLHAAGKGEAGGGQGRTKIDFKLKTDDFSTSRLFAKLDVAAAVATLPEVGAKSRNDNLAGYLVEFSITAAGGSPVLYTGVADAKGKIKTPFDGKLTANGGIMQIKYTGLDLVTLFPLNTADGSYEVPVTLTVAAKKVLVDAAGAPVLDANGMAQADPNSPPVTLSSQTVTFNYTTKNGQIKGRNF
jgi:hypothetical protein